MEPEATLDLAGRPVEGYFDAPPGLPGAAGSGRVDRYENQLGTGVPIYGLAGLALRARGGADPSLFPDDTAR